jgi:hypothetical protein
MELLALDFLYSHIFKVYLRLWAIKTLNLESNLGLTCTSVPYELCHFKHVPWPLLMFSSFIKWEWNLPSGIDSLDEMSMHGQCEFISLAVRNFKINAYLSLRYVSHGNYKVAHAFEYLYRIWYLNRVSWKDYLSNDIYSCFWIHFSIIICCGLGT